MMTIKGFANLCKCNAQTLRYYDKIDLLKPVKVDQASGYRYYTESQAIDFVKIKNLQAADFTIDEIKTLLTASDQQVYKAFDLKIAEQANKLERIKQIQQSYLTEKSNMEKLIRVLSDFLTSQLANFEILQEFGLTPEEGPDAVARLITYIEQQIVHKRPTEPKITLTVNDQVFHGVDHVADAIHFLNESNLHDTIFLGNEIVSEDSKSPPDQWETAWECHGWKYAYEFIDAIPLLDKGRDYCFLFQFTEEKYSNGVAFPMFLISTMLPKANSDNISLSCSVEKSTDGQNHFALLCRQ